MVRVNLSGGNAEFELLPSGKYPATITDGEIRQSGEDSKHPDSFYVSWEFTISEPSEYVGRKQWQNTGLLHYDHEEEVGCECDEEEKFNKWVGGTVRLAELAGIDTSQEDYEFDVDDFLGTPVTLVVGQRPYDGEMRNEVKRVRPAGDTAGAASSMLP